MVHEQRKQPENKPSSVLADDENKQIYSLIGPKCITIATAVAQLYFTKAPDHSYWNRQDVGVLCFIKDNHRKNYFFRMYCLRRTCKIWEQEVYKNMEYKANTRFLHSFEGDKCIYALNFACEREADQVRQIIGDKLEQLKLRAAQKEANNQIVTDTSTTAKRAKQTDKKSNSKKKDRKKKLTKEDIGKPTEFRHITKVRFDCNTGLNVNTSDEIYKEIFKKAGINDKMLENRKTREFLYDFVDAYPRNEASSHAPIRSAPKPPPNRVPPPPPARNLKQPSSKLQTQKDQSVPPNFAPPPPPPPPRPASLVIPPTNTSAPPPPPPPPPAPSPHTESTQKSANVSPIENRGGDMRSALLDSIRQGTTLKAVSASPATTRSDEPDRDDMLRQIKEGVSLRSATDRELNSPRTSVSEVNDIAMALKKAVAIRGIAMRTDDDTSSGSSSDDEWDA